VIAAVACLAAVLATALSFAADWRLELLSHFRPHLAVAAALLALLVLATDLSLGLKLALCLAALVAAAVNLRSIVRAIPKVRPVDGNARLRIAFANVLKSNTRYQPVIDWVRRERVDVFVVAEAVHGWPAALAVLRDELPFVAAWPRGDVMIFSRHKFLGEPHYVATANSHLAVAALEGITVMGVHTASPETTARSLDRDAMIALVANKVSAWQGAVLVAGDFNATPWSPPILKLIARTGLAYGPDARSGTFPERLGPLSLPWWLGIPIDLVMARGAAVITRRLGPRIGSDHWPVLADVQLGRVSDASM